jgi:hypothetical protein
MAAPILAPIALFMYGVVVPLRIIFLAPPYAAFMWLTDGEIDWEELKHSIFDDIF